MKTPSLKSLLGAVALLSAPAALAGLGNSQPLFESRMDAARAASSSEGTHVTRTESRTALSSFIAYDDGQVDASEYAYLAPLVSDESFLTGFTDGARQYFASFHELNDAATQPASMNLYPVSETPAEAFGVSGVLSNHASILEGYIPYGTGVANQVSLQWGYYSYFDITSVGAFDPLSEDELRSALAQRMEGQYASQAEIDGAVAYLNEIAGNSQRLYKASWKNDYGRRYPGGLGGFVIAAVSTDRRFVRFVEFVTWSE